jgi:hypothetical protein
MPPRVTGTRVMNAPESGNPKGSTANQPDGKGGAPAKQTVKDVKRPEQSGPS